MKKLILIAFSCIFFMGTIHGSKNDNAGVIGVVPVHESHYKKSKKSISKHTEPRFRNTFMFFTPEEIQCLAMNIYHEARNESLAGKVAVVLVTMNRVADDRFPNTICDVVHEGRHYYNKRLGRHFPKKNQCQFSWYCDGKRDTPANKRAYAYSVALAKYFLQRSMSFIDYTEGATHYHADYVKPWWSKHKKFIKTVKIDSHLFYRWTHRR